MKKIWFIFAIIVMVSVIILGTTYKEVNTEYLRIHIRGNSNLEIDQLVKYKIKDAVVEVLTPYVANCNSFEDVEKMLEINLDLVNNA